MNAKRIVQGQKWKPPSDPKRGLQVDRSAVNIG